MYMWGGCYELFCVCVFFLIVEFHLYIHNPVESENHGMVWAIIHFNLSLFETIQSTKIYFRTLMFVSA